MDSDLLADTSLSVVLSRVCVAMESLGYKQKNKMVYQMIENMKQKSIDFDQFLDMMTARIVSIQAAHTCTTENDGEITARQCHCIHETNSDGTTRRRQFQQFGIESIVVTIGA